MNNVSLIGRLGKDPEFKSSGDASWVNFSLATTSVIKGEKITQWHRCTAFNRTAEVIEQYVHKGDLLGVEGGIRYESYVDKDGIDRQATKIMVNRAHLLSSRPKDRDDQPDPEERPAARRAAATAAPARPPMDEFDDDDIPF